MTISMVVRIGHGYRWQGLKGKIWANDLRSEPKLQSWTKKTSTYITYAFFKGSHLFGLQRPQHKK
jgi:hypothetical protein